MSSGIGFAKLHSQPPVLSFPQCVARWPRNKVAVPTRFVVSNPQPVRSILFRFLAAAPYQQLRLGTARIRNPERYAMLLSRERSAGSLAQQK